MSIFNAMRISASGLTAEHLRLDTISNNIANVNTTRTEDGGAFKRQVVIFASRLKKNPLPYQETTQGVKVVGIKDDGRPSKMHFMPGHPDADKKGFVEMPNIEIVTEMADMISATRAYEANINAFKTSRGMLTTALSILR